MFRSDDLNIEIINIFLINREKCEYNTPKRPFHILTKRIKGCTDMTFSNQRFKAVIFDSPQAHCLRGIKCFDIYFKILLSKLSFKVGALVDRHL